MIIKPNSTIVVYMNTQQQYYRSAHSRFEIMIPENKMVGYIEDLGVLCWGYEIVYYDMNKYFNDVMVSDIDEMTYKDYLQYYHDRLERENPGAPVLNDMPAMIPGVQMNEYTQAPQREILKSNINVAGVNVKILRG